MYTSSYDVTKCVYMYWSGTLRIFIRWSVYMFYDDFESSKNTKESVDFYCYRKMVDAVYTVCVIQC